MNYASLLEAYNVESFEKKKKKKDLQQENDHENTINKNYSETLFNRPSLDSSFERMKTRNDLNGIKNYNIEEYKKDFTSCEPLQPPHYKYPLSEKTLENYDKAYATFLKERKINEYKGTNFDENEIYIPKKNNNKHNINIYENYDKIKMENINEIEPYHDEDLDNYLNINDFKSINYNYNNICENDNKKNLLRNNYKLKTQEPLKYNDDEYILIPKKKLNIKCNEKELYSPILNKNNLEEYDTDEEDIDEYTLEPIKKISEQKNRIRERKREEEYNLLHQERQRERERERIRDIEIQKEGHEKKNNNIETFVDYHHYNNNNNNNNNNKKSINNFYKSMINIGLFILIGIFIIFLLDLLIELALHKGMKQTVNILAPLLEELKTLRKKK
jgi:hypothetical protein